jgi:hypothetical protein
MITYTSGGTVTFSVTHGTDGVATSQLTGYSKALTSEQLAATDSVLQAFGKLEKRIDDNASQISQLADLSTMSFKVTDVDTSTQYAFGLQIKDGKTQLMYEEV